jgi:hypothetical protein
MQRVSSVESRGLLLVVVPSSDEIIRDDGYCSRKETRPRLLAAQGRGATLATAMPVVT